MYPTPVEQLQARVTALEVIVASLVEALSEKDPKATDLKGRVYGTATVALRDKLATAVASDVSFTNRALEIVSSSCPAHAL